jgi:hypothetical protein
LGKAQQRPQGMSEAGREGRVGTERCQSEQEETESVRGRPEARRQKEGRDRPGAEKHELGPTRDSAEAPTKVAGHSA